VKQDCGARTQAGDDGLESRVARSRA
jgi:hypothetical protein